MGNLAAEIRVTDRTDTFQTINQLTIPKGGYVEVKAFDCYVEVTCTAAIRGPVRNNFAGAGNVQHSSTKFIGPGGSACRFRVYDDGATLTYKVHRIFDTGQHCDPTTGRVASGTRDAFLRLSWCADDPYEPTSAHVSYSSHSAQSAIAASTTEIVGFPTGYARDVFVFFDASSTGNLIGRMPKDDGSGTDASYGDNVYVDSFSAANSGSISWHPWQALCIQNTNGNGTLSCLVKWETQGNP